MKLADFKCKKCGNEFEELYKTIEEVVCLSCGSSNVEKQLSYSEIAKFSIMSAEEQKKSLQKRSRDHTRMLKRKERFS